MMLKCDLYILFAPLYNWVWPECFKLDFLEQGMSIHLGKGNLAFYELAT